MPSDCSGSVFYNPRVIKTEAGGERGKKKGREGNKKKRLRGHGVVPFGGGRWKCVGFYSLTSDAFVLIRGCESEQKREEANEEGKQTNRKAKRKIEAGHPSRWDFWLQSEQSESGRSGSPSAFHQQARNQKKNNTKILAIKAEQGGIVQ